MKFYYFYLLIKYTKNKFKSKRYNFFYFSYPFSMILKTRQKKITRTPLHAMRQRTRTYGEKRLRKTKLCTSRDALTNYPPRFISIISLRRGCCRYLMRGVNVSGLDFGWGFHRFIACPSCMARARHGNRHGTRVHISRTHEPHPFWCFHATFPSQASHVE